MKRRKSVEMQGSQAVEAIIEELTSGAACDDEGFRRFLKALEAKTATPFDGFVIGEPVSVLAFAYDGNPRRGLTAKCRREDGAEHVVAVAEIEVPHETSDSDYLIAYRRWLGIESQASRGEPVAKRVRRHKATSADLDLSGPIELVVLSTTPNAARCRLIGSTRGITLRASRVWDVVPGEIAVVQPRKQWSYAGLPYLSGEIESTRLDVAALGLVPLQLVDQGLWRPDEHYWGEEDEPIEEWAKPIIARGPRQEYEMEQVLPGADPTDMDSDPIIRSNNLHAAGDLENADKILMEVCKADLRCLDAHAHLGNRLLKSRPDMARRHYMVGLRIGELSLGDDFDGLLPWGWVDNRPFLRCMHGYGLSLWRLGRFEESFKIFDRMLWLNPADNQGVRFLIDEVKAGTA